MALHAKRNCQGTLRNITGRHTQDLSRREVLYCPTRKAKKMARYRLRIAHTLDTREGHNVWLPGDTDNETVHGPEKGTIVGDGTPYIVKWPTLEMEPLDEEAEAAIEKERNRLMINDASMNPVEDIPVGGDDFEERYIPGTNRPRRAPKPDGAPARERSNA